MVLAYKLEEWIERDKQRVRERAIQTVDAWFATLGLPASQSIVDKAVSLTPAQDEALAHVIDLMKNQRCTNPTCRFRSYPVPEFLQE